jgi:alpha-ketoglutarate-dependent taurine dioxygenase
MATAPSLQAAADFTIRRVQPTIGAEIEGIDLSRKLSAEQIAAIRAAVIEHKVVFFRDQSLDNESHAAFAAEFGPLYTHPSARKDDNVHVVHAIAARDDFSEKPQILGLELSENRELLAEILRQYKRPEFQARFSWRPGTFAFWDNRATVHYAVKNYGDYPRKLHRILIADEPLYGDL